MAIQKIYSLPNHAQGDYWRIQEIQFDTINYNTTVVLALFISETTRQLSPLNPLDFLILKFTLNDLNISSIQDMFNMTLNQLKTILYDKIKLTYNEREIDFSTGLDV